MKEKELLQELKEINLLQQALGILDWDIQTGIPEKASNERSEVNSYLYSIYFSKKSTLKSKKPFITFLNILLNCLKQEKSSLKK